MKIIESSGLREGITVGFKDVIIVGTGKPTETVQQPKPGEE